MTGVCQNLRSQFVKASLVIIFLILAVQSASAWSGKVVKVADGDTITVRRDRTQIRIRLHGIDTPERKQAFGKKAKQFTARLTSGKTVEVERTDTDKYGRTVALISVGGINVNEALIESGFAWVYRKYCKQAYCRDWLQLEQHARTVRIGLWRDKNPIPPWEWRKKQRENPKAAAVGGLFHGNIKSHVFHRSSCRHFNCKNCTAGFDSQQEALRAGYRPHRECVKDN